jgi:hypothetical protein
MFAQRHQIVRGRFADARDAALRRRGGGAEPSQFESLRMVR